MLKADIQKVEEAIGELETCDENLEQQAEDIAKTRASIQKRLGELKAYLEFIENNDGA